MERKEKIANLIKKLSAQFLETENNHLSLISVTHCTLSSDSKRATIFLSIFPTQKEKPALEFCLRKRKELREFLKKKLPVRRIPFLDIKLDLGEKNRQKIDELLREK